MDVRGQGGYVCAGGKYSVMTELPVVAAPDWVYELVGTKGETPEGEPAIALNPSHPDFPFRVKSAELFLSTAPPCISGQGGQKQLWAVALRLMRTYELPIGQALELFRPYNLKCEPPWLESEVKRTFLNAAEKGHGPTGTFSPTFMAPEEKTEWRKRSQPGHEYEFDLAHSVSGGSSATQPYGPKDLASVFTGPASNPHWTGVWQFDKFRRRIVAVNPPLPLDAETIGLTNADKAKVQVWLACHGIRAGLEAIHWAITVATMTCQFHPVQDYLDSLPSVTVDEAHKYFDQIAVRLWGSERNEVESAYVKRFAVAAVRRIRKPGTKVDTILMLSGNQGYKKSLFCSHLFGEFFRDQMPPLANRDPREASMALEGYWGIEFAEMAAFTGAQEAIKKEFLTRAEDKYRPLWTTETLVLPRQCVFIGTTNEDEFLDDATGNSRYEVCEVIRPINLNWSRDEFWACANALERAGEIHFTDRAIIAIQPEPEQQRHNIDEAWTDTILNHCQGKKGQWITAAQVLTQAIALPLDRQSRAEMNRAKAILRRAFGNAQMQRINGRLQRAYLVPE